MGVFGQTRMSVVRDRFDWYGTPGKLVTVVKVIDTVTLTCRNPSVPMYVLLVTVGVGDTSVRSFWATAWMPAVLAALVESWQA